ncbi:MAG: hypothetical protein H0V45_16315 [Actinobacteria bacterium]|nr:hypothetical protein [Actinomycetota bacterium]
MNDVARRTTDDRHLETLGRLTRGALHEIANPLLALVGSAELALAEVEPGSKLHARLDTVRATGLEIAQIVRALQAFVRKRNEPSRPLSLTEAAEEAAALVGLVNSAPDIDVAARTEANPSVYEPPGAVARALVELLLDGLATAQGGDVVELVVREEGLDGVVALAGVGDGVVALAGVGELRLPKVDA